MVSEVSAMKIHVKLFAALLALVLCASGCAAVNYSYLDAAEPLNWREYDDC